MDDLKRIESTLAKALAEMLNYPGPHRAPGDIKQMRDAADKVADALGTVRFMGERA